MSRGLFRHHVLEIGNKKSTAPDVVERMQQWRDA